MYEYGDYLIVLILLYKKRIDYLAPWHASLFHLFPNCLVLVKENFSLLSGFYRWLSGSDQKPSID